MMTMMMRKMMMLMRQGDREQDQHQKGPTKAKARTNMRRAPENSSRENQVPKNRPKDASSQSRAEKECRDRDDGRDEVGM